MISSVMIRDELSLMLHHPVMVAMGAETMAVVANSVHCDVRLEPMALTYTMDEFRERYLTPIASYLRERMQ